MAVRARLAGTVPFLLSSDRADAPSILAWPGRRRLAQRSDGELVVCTLDDGYRARPGTESRFPAPWPRRRGGWALSPDAGLAVSSGVHALRAVEVSGAVRWQVRHGCRREGWCTEMHSSFDEYARRPDHRYPKSGSVGFSIEGKLVWAHVCGPLADDAPGSEAGEL
jgi:hypothetical protein